MSKKKDYCMVRASVYNGYKNVLFLMNTQDFRLRDELFRTNYDIVTFGTYTRSKSVRGMVNGSEDGVFHGENNVKYLVFSDYSAKAMK